MFCTKCGGEVKEGSNFCTRCGNAVHTATVPDTLPPTEAFGGSAPEQMKVPPQQQTVHGKKPPVKILVIAGAAIAVLAVFWLCFSLFASVDVYAVGQADDTAVYWKNGKMVRLPGASSMMTLGSGIYVSGKDVHVSGWIDGDMAYWKNGGLVKFPDNENSTFASPKIYGKGKDVYISGYVDNDNGGYWKNGKLIKLPCIDVKNMAMAPTSIWVSGNDVYVSALIVVFENGKIKENFLAAYWKNDEIIPLLEPGSLDNKTNSICVADNDIYIAANRDGDPVLWKNGAVTKYGKNGSANSVYVSGKDVYVAGTDNDVAVYWKNGVKYELQHPSNMTGKSSARGIYTLGKNVYVGGTIGDDAALWKNGKIITLSETGKKSDINEVFVVKKARGRF